MPIQPITMPKWGLAMQEGTLVKWAVEEGAQVTSGQEIADIETTKIANVYESPVAGVLRRKVAQDGDTLPVGALLAVLADPATPVADIDAYVSDFLANFKVEEERAEAAVEPEYADVAGKRIRYLKLGPDVGTPAVLIHGFGADLGSFMFNQAAIAEDRPVFAVDLPGHGSSSKDVGDGSLDKLVADILAFLQVVGISKAHLVGHSLGGAIATSIALARPERIQSLTLLAPAGFGPDISQSFIDGFIAETRTRKLKPVLEMLVANPELVSAAMVEDVLKFKRLDGAVEALRKVAGHLAQNSRQVIALRDRLPELTMPAAVIWGEQDQVLPARQAEGLPPAFRVTRFADAGHLAHMEKSGEVNAVIKRQLTS
ncbi:MAG: acetoin dehydrogenase dihydrolipoyllysine-residue acetyltransferase subunit [Methylobacteriaceae bacterium]|nr:acetoin dehydrogenase dihydrolipoyllysine-residue acetyltransferase subunit [Methylobacteriaceae bacterium]MBV9247605.1 acetoin dehydrogenase dihydrolipoyllysine-residue acetyltransferase subunit [Methylobacteriaceae bacterium]MBV9637473.1 acetoin dehydrogenase dihydrolipoyllysine-residue acetyltransferase subunit [Methylobacteriaceae bacterium]